MGKVETYKRIEKSSIMPKKGGFGKRGVFMAFANPIALIFISIAAVLVLTLFFGFAVFLAFNVFTLIGATLLILSAVSIFMGRANNIVIAMGLLGLVMIALPYFSDSLSDFTLAAVIAK